MMKKIGYILLAAIIVIGVFAITGCGEKQEEDKGINVNKIEVMASAKLLAASKVIEKEEFPEDIAYITEDGSMTGLNLDMVSALYIKADPSKEAFDKIHDYRFLFSNEGKSAQVSVCKDGTPLRDYFFQSTEELSSIFGVDARIYLYDGKYIVRLEKNGYYFDIETTGMEENEMLFFVSEVVR